MGLYLREVLFKYVDSSTQIKCFVILHRPRPLYLMHVSQNNFKRMQVRHKRECTEQTLCVMQFMTCVWICLYRLKGHMYFLCRKVIPLARSLLFPWLKVIYIYIYMQQVCSSDKNEKNEAFFRLWAHPWKIQVQIYMNLPKEEFVAGISWYFKGEGGYVTKSKIFTDFCYMIINFTTPKPSYLYSNIQWSHSQNSSIS